MHVYVIFNEIWCLIDFSDGQSDHQCTCLADVVQTESKLICEETLLVSVKRGLILNAAVRCAKRIVFSPNKKLKASLQHTDVHA